MAKIKSTHVPTEAELQAKNTGIMDHVMAFFLKNRTMVLGAFAALILIVAGYGLYQWYQSGQDDQASEKSNTAVRAFEAGQYRQALDGVGGQPGLLKIASEYGGTKTGNLAKYYAAVALDRVNDRKKALTYFEDFDKGSDFLGAAAYSSMAGIEEDLNKNNEKAASLYEQAANVYPDATVAPDNLRKAARAYEAMKNYDAARKVYETVKSKYPESAGGLDFFIARLDAMSGKK